MGEGKGEAMEAGESVCGYRQRGVRGRGRPAEGEAAESRMRKEKGFKSIFYIKNII